MKNKNRVELRGFLGADPKLTAGADGKDSMCSLSLCTNEEYIDKNTKTTVTRSSWHRVVAFGRKAENAAKYLVKGSEAEIIGRLHTREYEVKGEKRYITEVIANEIEYGRRPTAKEEAPAASVQTTSVRSENFEVNDTDPF